jgi:hypothetical protein
MRPYLEDALKPRTGPDGQITFDALKDILKMVPISLSEGVADSVIRSLSDKVRFFACFSFMKCMVANSLA